MRQFFFLFILSLFLSPIPVAAQDVQDICGDGGLETTAEADCFCSTTSGQTVNRLSVLSVQECTEACGNDSNLANAAINYQVQCSGTNTPVASGQILLDVIGLDATESDLSPPVLNIDIPGLTFSTPTIEGGNIKSNYLAEYVSALYAWILGAGALIAVVLIMIAGLQWILAGGDATAVGKAKDRIEKAITGLVLVLFAYTIAYWIDPSTTQFSALTFPFIKGQEFLPPDGENWDISPVDIPENTVPITGDHVIDYTSNHILNQDAVTALAAAGDQLYEWTGKNLTVTSGTRDLTHQARLFYDNCLTRPSRSCSITTCNVAAGSPVISGNSSGYTLSGELKTAVEAGERSDAIRILVENAKIGNCPHTSTIAVDAWCEGSGQDYKYDTECQYRLMEAMLNNGFCRLSVEPWHFELNKYKVSTACSTGLTSSYTRGGEKYNPSDGDTCVIWDYKNNRCDREP